MKRFIVKATRTQKFISAVLGLFIASFGVWAIIKSLRTKNIAGAWKLTFTIQSSTYRPYIGETHTQKVFFTQNDENVAGNGEKWEYNGELLPFDAHRLLEYEGTINGSQLNAKYVLHGLKRISNGNIEVEISSDEKTLKGSFTGTAADTKGMVTGERAE
jgi:hypothetical protein